MEGSTGKHRPQGQQPFLYAVEVKSMGSPVIEIWVQILAVPFKVISLQVSIKLDNHNPYLEEKVPRE